jgi:hypothetical protein
MGHPFVPLLVLLILPLAFFAYRRGLRSRPITWALYLACLAWLGASAWAGGVPFAELDRIKLMVAAAAIAALVGRSLGLAGLGERRVYRTTLFLIAAVAWVLYSNFFAFHGMGRERVFIHLHDVAHYYLGAKYFPELGYQSLYTALLRAEAEKYQDHFRSLEARDLETNGLVDIRVLLARSDSVKARFTPKRWQAFREDAGFFRDAMREQWGAVLRDHGFNPPPTWPLLGGPLANLVPAGSRSGILALTLLDPFLLLAMFAAIAWAFGVETMLLASIYFCTIYGASFGWIGGGFFRFLWLASLAISICCLAQGRHATAGSLVGLSTMLRIFPAWFAVPTALWSIKAAIARRELSPRHLRFLLAFAATCAALFAATLTLPAGLEHWQDFRQNMQRHVSNDAWNSIGLNEIVSYTGPTRATTPEGFAREQDWRRTTWRAQIAVVVLFLVLILARRSRWPGDVSASALAIPLLFCTLTLAAYYYAFLILLVVAHRESSWRLGALFGVEILTGLLALFEGREIVLYFYRNILVACLLIALIPSSNNPMPSASFEAPDIDGTTEGRA